MNPRIRQRAIDLILFLSQAYHTQSDSILPLVIKPIETKITSVPAKLAKARLELTNQLLNDYGLEQHEGHSSWSSANIIKFTQPFLSHTNAEVRDVASTLLANIALLKGSDLVLESITDTDNHAVQKKIFSMNDVSIVLSNGSSPKIGKNRDNPKRLNPKPTKGGQPIQKNVKIMATVENASETHSRRSTVDSDLFQTICIFCGYEDINFTEETLDLHYWKECPALMVCPHCSMLVEIAEFNQHLILDCGRADEFISCPKCKMVVQRAELSSHKQGPLCRALHFPDSIRCPLCWQDFRGVNGIRSHLTLKPGCPESNRPPLKDKSKAGIQKQKQSRFQI
jgi:centrosomal protein CEP104